MKLYELMDEKYLKPILEYKEKLDGWNNIEIRENGEKLVSLKYIDEKIIISPQYFIDGIDGAENDCRIRENIAKKLILIANRLPEGFKLLIWDSYRTIKTQNSLFDMYYNKFKNELQLEENELLEYTKKFVSLTSLEKKRPSPHNTGGAIDLTICDNNGNSINMGTYFDDFRPESYTRFFEEKRERGEILEEEKEILLNRRILCNLFAEEGFMNYPYEIWHKSFGDQMASKILNLDYAIYGGIEGK